MRLVEVKGTRVADTLAAATARPEQERGPWALRREWRSTFRDGLTPSERVVAGRHWGDGEGRSLPDGADVPVSLEVGVAGEIGATVGDVLVWDVQGLEVRSRVVSLRAVEWARFGTNFFAVFPRGPLDAAPHVLVTLARLDDPAGRGRLQRLVGERFPNVSALDLAQVRDTVEDVLGRASAAVRFLALFSLAAGAVVLGGAVDAGRWQRLRESALLRALGATRGQVFRVLAAEHAALGLLAALLAVGLSAAAGAAFVRFVLEAPLELPALRLAAVGAGVAALAVTVGLAGSRDAVSRPPLQVLREE
jgi:putative ABC transport system permease protein